MLEWQYEIWWIMSEWNSAMSVDQIAMALSRNFPTRTRSCVLDTLKSFPAIFQRSSNIYRKDMWILKPGRELERGHYRFEYPVDSYLNDD